MGKPNPTQYSSTVLNQSRFLGSGPQISFGDLARASGMLNPLLKGYLDSHFKRCAGCLEVINTLPIYVPTAIVVLNGTCTIKNGYLSPGEKRILRPDQNEAEKIVLLVSYYPGDVQMLHLTFTDAAKPSDLDCLVKFAVSQLAGKPAPSLPQEVLERGDLRLHSKEAVIPRLVHANRN